MPADQHRPHRSDRTLRSVAALADTGLITPDAAPGLLEVARRYAISVTPTIRDRMSGNPGDPLHAQFVPTTAELDRDGDELQDPVGDDRFSPLPGVSHRYRDRVLLKPSHVCPVYCRFCFRRETVGPGSGLLSEAELEAAYAYIHDHEEVWEVILTGGDPLMLAPSRLRRVIARLDEIEHVRVIRIHSRIPVVSPERVTAELTDALHARSAVWVVLHCNHRQELGPEAASALGRLSAAGIPLLGQTVLLKGVNDDANTLEQLLRRLVELKVKPYYLHQGDLAPGTAHFRTTIEAGQELARSLRGPVSGLCQAVYVLDIPGGWGKVPIGPTYLRRDAHGYVVTDPRGDKHRYDPESALIQEGTA